MKYLNHCFCLYILVLFSCSSNNTESAKHSVKNELKDSINNSKKELSFVFMNYPEFINSYEFDSITAFNISNSKLFKNEDKLYYSLFTENKQNFIFEVTPQYRNKKLLTIKLYTEIENISKEERRLINENVRKVFSSKYGTPEESKIKIEKQDGFEMPTLNKDKSIATYYEVMNLTKYSYYNELKKVDLSISEGNCKTYKTDFKNGKETKLSESNFIFFDINFYSIESYKVFNGNIAREKQIEKVELKANINQTQTDI